MITVAAPKPIPSPRQPSSRRRLALAEAVQQGESMVFELPPTRGALEGMLSNRKDWDPEAVADALLARIERKPVGARRCLVGDLRQAHAGIGYTGAESFIFWALNRAYPKPRPVLRPPKTCSRCGFETHGDLDDHGVCGYCYRIWAECEQGKQNPRPFHG